MGAYSVSCTIKNINKEEWTPKCVYKLKLICNKITNIKCVVCHEKCVYLIDNETMKDTQTLQTQ